MIIYFEYTFKIGNYSNGKFQNFKICEDDKAVYLNNMGYFCEKDFDNFGGYITYKEMIYLEQALQPYGDYYLLGLHDFIKKHLRELKLKRICENNSQ